MELLKAFNEDLKAWSGYSHCTANFAWTYDHTGQKKLEVTEIVRPIFRRDAPDGDTLGSLLAQHDAGTLPQEPA